MPQTARPGDVLADRYRLVDLLSESRGGRFWRAHDRVLERHVALHVIDDTDDRAPGLVEAARRSATVLDRRVLRVLDAERLDGVCYVVNEWGTGTSLDIMLATAGPLSPRKAAWLVAEVADSVANAHAAGVSHGRLVPENVLVERTGHVKVIGLSVDAALHGLPPDRAASDVIDLAGLLYAALTGRWAGASPSAVPDAPVEHGHVLRPRQVRAGVPRPLDALCEAVLLPGTARARDLGDVTTARSIAAFLADFVGDPTGMPEALAATTPAVQPQAQVVLPPVPDLLPHDAEPEPEPTSAFPPAPAPLDEPTRQEVAPPRPASVDLPTQAGLPIFDDAEDDVSWLERRTEPVPPPPPFEEPPDRPLFAPETEGRPARRPRPGTGPHTGSTSTGGFWPWDTGHGVPGGPLTGTGAPLPLVGLDDEQDEVPGRRWFRLAVALALCAAVLVATVVAVNLGRGRTVLGEVPGADAPSSTASAADSLRVLEGVTADDFDPQATPPEELPELVGLAVDGNPRTAWRTSTYEQQLGPGGLKTGVGLLLDLGSPREVAEVGLTMVGAPTEVSVYVTETAPIGVRDLPVAGSATVPQRGRVTLEEPVTGRYVVVWLTSLPAVDTGYRAEVAEVVVRG